MGSPCILHQRYLQGLNDCGCFHGRIPAVPNSPQNDMHHPRKPNLDAHNHDKNTDSGSQVPLGWIDTPFENIQNCAWKVPK